MAKLLEELESLVRELVEERKWILSRVSEHLKQEYPGTRGLSLRSVERFCQLKDIHHRTSRLNDTTLDHVVSDAINMVGPTYGRKTMTGLLRSRGISVSKARVGTSLRRVDPTHHIHRSRVTRRHLNPVPYHADYFGHKLHIDQNEKLVMFGVTHICAVDGFSGKIVGFITMPVKNCLEIYRHLYRPLTLDYGLWDQIRVDHGKEWHLMLFMQEQLANYRYNYDRAPHLQTTSKLNHCVERLWVEINKRVNYPKKLCLIHLEERGEIDMDDLLVKFCVSLFTIRVAIVGTTMATSAWNEHSVPGQGIPNERMLRANHVAPIDPNILPETEVAVEQMESLGSHLTRFSPFGQDPLEGHGHFCRQRDEQFEARFPNYDDFFHSVANSDFTLFRQGLLYTIEITRHLELQLNNT
ncbi:PREDICTED: uncharacterized protein LOC109581281 [Amphimedon queenslandica]|uniref:Integrase core domain-containing protein n=1 Tax=Amphimedon queenslandica TaxID=400682 RepID=A0A1X7V4V7_AMPQE|nr:PREDICTED: uncharacterized protein LOC109581281 [Amphimedon queenslandica]|eukprot:XP_019850817.1 PREDICTED: uncharacterized protein LOC109581281 [Amphimedon queenslandica]